MIFARRTHGEPLLDWILVQRKCGEAFSAWIFISGCPVELFTFDFCSPDVRWGFLHLDFCSPDARWGFLHSLSRTSDVQLLISHYSKRAVQISQKRLAVCIRSRANIAHHRRKGSPREPHQGKFSVRSPNSELYIPNFSFLIPN